MIFESILILVCSDVLRGTYIANLLHRESMADYRELSASDSDADHEVNDIEQGAEPGGCSEHYLVTAEPWEELEASSACKESNGAPRNKTSPKSRMRKRSGTIENIKKQIKKQQSSSNKVESLKHMDSLVSLDDGGGNSSAASASVSETESDYDSIGHSHESDLSNDPTARLVVSSFVVVYSLSPS